MKKPPLEELSQVRQQLAKPQYQSPYNLRNLRKRATRLKRKIEAAFKRLREKDEQQQQLTLRLK